MDTVATTPMEINDNEDELSEAETWFYNDQDIDLSDDEINEINWRYIFQDTLNHIREKKLDDGAKPLPFDNPCKIRIKKLGDIPFIFPLSNALCSRIICEHGAPLALANKYDFCGTKVVNSAWQIDRHSIDFPLSFSAAIRTSTLEQLHLTSSNISSHFELNLHKLVMFGPCSQSKIYNFDDQLFIYLATVLVFLPSTYTGGNYRFIDDNDDDDNIHRHVFQREDSDRSKAFILVVPSDCQHEIESIESGFKLLLVYHLVSTTNSIDQLYSLLSKPTDELMTMENIFLIQRLIRVFTYWEKNIPQTPNKLLISLQHPLDYSSYFSILFRDRYRVTLQLIITAMQSFSSFLIYSATMQHDEPSGDRTDSRFFLHSLQLLNSTNQLTLDLHSEHERTFLPHEFLGDLQAYIDAFEQAGSRQHLLPNGTKVLRNDLRYHVLVLIPCQSQWDLLLDDHLFAYHHLSFMFSLPTHSLNQSCLNLFECILRDRVSTIRNFEKIIEYLIRLHQRFGLTKEIIELVKILLKNRPFKEQLFANKELYFWLNRLAETFSSWSMFSTEFFDLFRQVLCSSMPMKLNEIVQFLLQFPHRTLRALLINTLIRFTFKSRTLPRHILFSTFCSLIHLLVVDGSYSPDALLLLAYHLIKRIRKTALENEIIDKHLKIHVIPTLVHIYRDIRASQPISPAFVLIYEFCLNTLNYYCSTAIIPSRPLNIISNNEALLICPCASCQRLKDFLINPNLSTLIIDLSISQVFDHCLRHTLSRFPMLSMEYKHDPCTGREQTLLVSKCGYEEEQKQVCFHLRRLLMQLHKM